jgi:hypothetical protein
MPAAGQTIKPLVKLGKRPEDCWTWLGPTTEAGHGKKTYCGQNLMAHRWLWEMLFGPIPCGLVVYATCDTKGCINPHHLACGFQADANRQSVQTKLLPQDVQDIKRALKERSPAVIHTLAERHGVNAAHIREIANGRAWGARKRNTGPKQPRNGREASCAS